MKSETTRAKYQCNPKLAYLIELANLLPPNFNFYWEEEKKEQGFDTAFEKWKKLFFALSISEQMELVGLDFGINYVSYPTSLSKKLTKQNENSFCLRAVANSQEILGIRNFLKRAILLFKIAQEKEIKSLINANEDAFDAFNKLYSDINPLLEFIACWKLFEYFRNEFESVRAKNRKALLVYLTARYIQLDKHAEFGCSKKEALDFIEEWKKQFFIKDLESDEAERLTVILDVLANSAISLENQIPNFTLEVEREGRVKIAVPFIAEAMQDVNISRLRICEYCKKLFWANRKDAYTCSPKHARNRRMRLLRKNWKEKGDLYIKARRKKAKKQKEK